MIAETQRLILRPLTPDDAADLFRIYSDALVMQYMGTAPATVEQEKANIEAHVRDFYGRHGFGLWPAVLKSSKETIGWCGLLRYELNGRPETEISYLLDRRHWGQGYATEAGAAVVRIAFEELGLDRLIALIAPANTVSARVAARLGFQWEGKVEYKRFGLVDLYARGRNGVG